MTNSQYENEDTAPEPSPLVERFHDMHAEIRALRDAEKATEAQLERLVEAVKAARAVLAAMPTLADAALEAQVQLAHDYLDEAAHEAEDHLDPSRLLPGDPLASTRTTAPEYNRASESAPPRREDTKMTTSTTSTTSTTETSKRFTVRVRDLTSGETADLDVTTPCVRQDATGLSYEQKCIAYDEKEGVFVDGEGPTDEQSPHYWGRNPLEYYAKTPGTRVYVKSTDSDDDGRPLYWLAEIVG